MPQGKVFIGYGTGVVGRVPWLYHLLCCMHWFLEGLGYG